MNAAVETPAVVVGGGPAGLAAALALETAGLSVTLAAAPHRPGDLDRDRRTAALFVGSVELLRNLGVWNNLREQCAPLLAIRLIDDTGRLLRAPEVVFKSEEVGLEAFGYNVPNDLLVEALTARVAATAAIVRCSTAGVDAVRIQQGRVLVTVKDGQEFRAQLAVAADGRNSVTRQAAGIPVKTWAYPQTAIVTWFSHQRSHEGVSTEFHRTAGPFTTVPMPGTCSSLVWVEEPGEAGRLGQLSDSEFRRAIERRLGGLLGTVGEVGPRAAFPLSGLTPDVFGRNRVALVGESGHVIPPIGAQGLNLGLRDAATLADCVTEALQSGGDPGGSAVTDRYSALRTPDVTGRITAVDILNRTLLSPYLPVHLMRGFGLHVLNTISPLRRLLVSEGVQPTAYVPALMRADKAISSTSSATAQVSPA